MHGKWRASPVAACCTMYAVPRPAAGTAQYAVSPPPLSSALSPFCPSLLSPAGRRGSVELARIGLSGSQQKASRAQCIQCDSTWPCLYRVQTVSTGQRSVDCQVAGWAASIPPLSIPHIQWPKPPPPPPPQSEGGGKGGSRGKIPSRELQAAYSPACLHHS